jgi:hypothetical protein
MIFKFRLILIMTLMSFFKVESKDFIAYNRYINKAELAIIDDKLIEAVSYFDSAMMIDSVSYAQDLYNASICALKTGKIETSLQYCYKLAARGVGEDFFKKKETYNSLTKHPDWNNLLQFAHNKRNKFTQQNQRVIKMIDSLVQKDQAMNKRWRESGRAKEVEKLMDITNDTIATALNNLLLKEGFLSEKIIGATPGEDGQFYIRTPFDVIIIHNYESRRVGDTLFNNVLRKALTEGFIKQDYYAFIRDFAGGPNTIDHFGSSQLFVQYGCTIYKNKYSDLPAIEKNRNRIGLCTLDEYTKKIIFNIQNPNTVFQINGNCGRIANFKNAESESMFLKSNEIFIKGIPNCEY